MRNPACLLLCLLPAAAADMPRHLFSAGPLTAASGSPPRAIARQFLAQWAASAGLKAEDIAGAYVVKEYRTAHNGVTHLVYRQQFQGIDVYNSEWTVNIDRDGRVLNAGGELVAAPAGLARPSPALALKARGVALRAASSRRADDLQGQPVWFRVNGRLRPAFLFSVPDDNGVDVYATVVDSDSEKILSRENLTLYQAPTPRGMVFQSPSPQPSPTPGLCQTTPPPYVERTMQSFAGDPQASPLGWVSGNETAGNNVVAAANPLGINFLPGAMPCFSPNRDFTFPLQLGPGAPNPTNFTDAATTNLFYWANRAHDLFYRIGFDEAAGNFQQENLGRGGVGGDPMFAFSQFGSAANSYAAMNNAFFTMSRAEDGGRVSINMYVGGSAQNDIFSDGSFDAAVIIHEYTHGVSTRLVRQLSGGHGGSMGEGWSDFFSLEFTLPDGAPLDGAYPAGEYLFQSFGTGIRTRPYSTDMAVNPLTFQSLGHVSGNGPEVHAEGEIWVEALWEMRANLIRQLGEKEGRRRVRLLVIDGMKLSPPAPTMVDMRDAILLADRVDFQGASQDPIWSAFAKRGLGVLAHAADPNAVHVLASFEKPSPVASMRLYESRYVVGETVRVVLQDANETRPSVRVRLLTGSGDMEEINLAREGSIYLGSIYANVSPPVTKSNGRLEVMNNDWISAFYLDPDANGAPQLISAAAPTQNEYALSISPTAAPPTGTERPLFSFPSGSRVYGYISAPVVLPFEFPFFDRKFTAVRVHSDGLLTFDLPNFSACSDHAGLVTNTAIAPLWMDLAYGGSAQKNENVYMTTGPDWVMFRWAGETQPISMPFVVPAPVNFSAVLYQDGRIRFFYGDGNHDLANSRLLSASYGCEVTAPVVGISNGHDAYYNVSIYHDGNPNLEKAPAAFFDPPFGPSSEPQAILESPAADEHQQGLLTVKGLAWDDGVFVTRIDIVVDGVVLARSYPTTPRNDFCATRKVRACPMVGFTASLNPTTLGLETGAHTLQVRAFNSRGAFSIVPEQPLTFYLDEGQSGQPVGAIEVPADGAELSGTVQIKGYAYAPDLRVSAVDVIIDGMTYAPAAYNQKRDDICSALTGAAPPNCPNVGFQATLDTRTGSIQLPNGPHTLQVRVRDAVGRYTLIPAQPLHVTVNNPTSQPPKGVLTTPAPNATLSGSVHIAGYAWDPDGRVTSAVLLVDGQNTLSLRYGQPRPEECAALTDAPQCPDIGFEGDLDTRWLSNGVHALGIRITDDQRNTTIVPLLIRYGMNVAVAN